MYKIELHAHTAEVSGCSIIDGRALAMAYAAAGYHTLVITDHYYDALFERMGPSMPWAQKAEAFLSGYRAARDAGCIRVLPGMEYRNCENGNDYLVYGVTEAFLHRHEALYALPFAAFFDLCQREGLMVFQAHPFRPGMVRQDPRLLHGVEVYNGNIRHNSNNPMALAFAQKAGLLGIAGSDTHREEDVGTACMESARPVENNARLLALLRSCRV